MQPLTEGGAAPWWWRARTLGELLADGRHSPSTRSTAPTAASDLRSSDRRQAWKALEQRWVDNVAAADPNQFERRLAQLGVDAGQVEQLFVSPPDPSSSVPPAWAACTERARANAREAARSGSLRFERDAEHPFARVLECWVEVGRDLLTGLGGTGPSLSDGVLVQLEGQLLRRLAMITGTALLEQFETSRAATVAKQPMRTGGARAEDDSGFYRAWVADQLTGGVTELVEQFPMAGRLTGVATLQWAQNVRLLSERLDGDRDLLRQRFGWGASDGVVADISSPLGDDHNGGQHVLALTDVAGVRVVYKPRSLDMEEGFGELLQWCNDRLPLAQLVPVVAVRDGYGWMELIEPRPLPDAAGVARFYRRAGTLLRLAELVGVNDLHFENVLAVGEHPVLVDLECSVQPTLVPSMLPGSDWAGRLLRDSVLATGLLPGVLPAPAILHLDLSGFGAEGNRATGRTGPRWQGLGTDRISLAEGLVTSPKGQNRPRPNDGEIPVEELIAGYRHADEALERDLPPLDALRRGPVRIVHQATPVYGAILRRSLQPDVLRDGLRHSIELESLFDRAFVIADRCGLVGDDSWPFVMAEGERAALTQLDVPWFLSDPRSLDLRVVDAWAADCFESSGAASMDRRLAAPAPQRTALQVDLIRIAFEGTGIAARSDSRATGQGTKPAVRYSDNDSTRALDVALAIGEELSDRALHVSNSRVRWLEAIRLGNTAHFRPELDAEGLYVGAAGTAVFLAALARVTGEVRWADLAVRALDMDRLVEASSSDSGLGAWEITSGLGGLAYAAATVGELIGDQQLTRTAADATAALHEPATGRYDKLDLVGGWAGVVAAQLAVAARDGRDAPEATATIGRRIIELAGERDQSGQPAGHHRIGMAHGGTGLALVLARAARATGDDEMRAAAEQIVTRENERAERRDAPGRIRRDGPAKSVDPGWCWGTAGFAMGRCALIGLIDDDLARCHLERAVQHTSAGPAGSDRLCCGSPAQLAAITAAGPVVASTSDRPLLEHLVDPSRSLVLEPGLNVRLPSLFRGISGVGYSLLHAGTPDALPSVLTFD